MSIVESKISDIEKSKNKLRKYLIKEVNAIKQTVKINQLNSNCFTISFSEIAKGNLILSPDYYQFDKQKKVVCDKIQKHADCGVKYLNMIVEKGRDNDIVFHPDFLSQISTILKK